MEKMKYASIHGHSTFSFQDGFGTVEEHVERVASLGMTALALTEHGNVSSHVQLERAAEKHGIKPLYGVEAYFAPSKQQSKFHQTILAMDEKGYQNLNRLVTDSWLPENHYYKPTVSPEALEKYNEGLIVTSGCASSILSCTLLGGKSLGDERLEYTDEDFQACLDIIEWYTDIFGDRYYLEVQGIRGLPRTAALNVAFEKMSKITGVPLVATSDVHYPFPDDNEMQVLLHSAGRGKTAEQSVAGWDYDIKLTYPESDWEIYDTMRETGLSKKAAKKACRNTAKIVDRCTVKLPKNEPIKFPASDYGYDTVEELVWDKLREGIEFRKTETRNQRLIDHEEEYWDRVKYEMERIVPRGFCDYFMMLADAVVFAKESKIAVGPARGSAAASLVCYLLRITEVDPLQFPTMMFERFIDPKRLDLPDVDLDFDDRRRGEVIEHLRQRWGADHVGNIGNFVRYRGKNSIGDVATVYSIPKWAAETVKDLILDRSGGDSRAADSLEDTFDTFPKAKEMLNKFPKLWDATRLEGNTKGLSIHAAGIVISNTPITDTCATYSRTKSNGDAAEVIPYDKKDAEYLGMLKADFLGLSTMGIIGRALDLIGMDLETLYRVPLDDAPTLEAFHNADVFGIFQFEGRATRLVCRDVAPDNFMELADINALSRPGPLFSGMTAQYIDIKHGRKKAEKLHPIVDQYTAHSKGQIVYQEQVLGIIRDLGGFPVQRVGDIRKIISQKLGEASFNAMFEEFEKGARELHGVDSELAARIWKFMVTSATYSFNIAHSVSYSMLAFWAMWLKVNYSKEFYAAALPRLEGKNNHDKRVKLIRDANRRGVEVLPPDLVDSQVSWSVVDRGVLAGWLEIPGVGPVTANAINDLCEKRDGFDAWDELGDVKGIGPKTIEKIQAFCESDDPFGIGAAGRVLSTYRTAFLAGESPAGLPVPTHTSSTMPETGDHDVVWMGFVKKREYKDLIEDERARSGDSLDEIRARVKDPDLAKSCTLHGFDDGDEDVYLRVSRWKFPHLADDLEDIDLDTDMVIAVGRKREGFGLSIQVKELYVIDTTED